MFTEEECDKLLDFAMQQQPLWTRRGSHPFGSLHTLGGVSAFGNQEQYQEYVKLFNPILWDALRPEYERVLEMVHEYTGWHVSYHSQLALPGFQIFTNVKDGGDRRLNGGIIHQDYLWKDREIKDILSTPEVDYDYSSTVAVSKQPCELDIWDEYPNGEVRNLIYKRGKVTPHDHQKMHQVPYTGSVGDKRITLQIRGYRIGNRIVLYL